MTGGQIEYMLDFTFNLMTKDDKEKSGKPPAFQQRAIIHQTEPEIKLDLYYVTNPYPPN